MLKNIFPNLRMWGFLGEREGPGLRGFGIKSLRQCRFKVGLGFRVLWFRCFRIHVVSRISEERQEF